MIDFKALAAPIPQNRVKTKPGRGGGTFSYITARTVMNRLDQAVGPENWRDDFRELSSGNVMCTIFIRVDGEWIGKSDIGTESDVEEDKGAFSDAFKRAGVKWGIARELYKEGTAYDDPQPPRPATAAPRTPPAKPAPKAEPEPEVDPAEAVNAAGGARDETPHGAEVPPVAMDILALGQKAVDTFPWQPSQWEWTWSHLVEKVPKYGGAMYPAALKLGLSREQVHALFGVESMKDLQRVLTAGQVWTLIVEAALSGKLTPVVDVPLDTEPDSIAV